MIASGNRVFIMSAGAHGRRCSMVLSCEWIVRRVAVHAAVWLAVSVATAGTDVASARHPEDILVAVMQYRHRLDGIHANAHYALPLSLWGVEAGSEYRISIEVKAREADRVILQQSRPLKDFRLTQTSHQRVDLEVVLLLPARTQGVHAVRISVYDDFPGLSEEDAFLTQRTFDHDLVADSDIAASAPSFHVKRGCMARSSAEASNVLSYEEFAAHPESFACCKIHGSLPLDVTLKDFLTWSHGFFLEAGAYDGLTQSNTAIFERYFGWDGLLVEPSLKHIDSILRNRPHAAVIHAALGNFSAASKLKWTLDPGGDPTGSAGDACVPTTFSGGSGGSEHGSVGGCTVRVVALSELLDELGVEEQAVRNTHFWSIDVEGRELEVLRGVDFSRHRPRFLLIEVMDEELVQGPHAFGSLGGAWEGISGFLKNVGYHLVKASRKDEFGSMSGWSHYTKHRDFLFAPRESLVHSLAHQEEKEEDLLHQT